MGEKLTERQRLALIDLRDLPENETWLPLSKSVLGICHALKRKGLAHYREGHPLGFTITPAGRAALSREEGR